MKKSLLFAASLLMLLVSACSQVPAPLEDAEVGLTPQFGSADEDVGVDVAFVSTGRIYSLSKQEGDIYYNDGGISYYSESYETIFLKRQDNSGKVLWTREIDTAYCSRDRETGDPCGNVDAPYIVADSLGNVRVLTWSQYYDGDEVDSMYTQITTYNASGNYVTSLSLPESRPNNFAVDSGGNTYVASRNTIRDYYNNYGGYTTTYIDVIAKYSANGTLLWQRTSTVGTPTYITVSSTGNVFVVGTKGVARYSNSGNLSWTKAGNFEEVMVSGSNLYTRYRTDVFKFDGTGKQLWKRTQSGLTSMVIAEMVGDGNGNVYLAGKFSKTSTNRDAFARKLNSSGSVLWTKQYGTSAYDDARGIATLNGSEIYITGSTKGALSHPNIGGLDGYLRKMDSSGNRVWTR